MTRWFMVAAVGALSACASTKASQAPAVKEVTSAEQTAPARVTRRQTIRSVLSQNVRVVVVAQDTPVRSASGVVVGTGTSPEGAVTYVMTNTHVVAPRPGETPRFLVLVDLPTGDTQEFAAKVIAQGTVPEIDLAVLSVSGISLDAATLAGDSDLTLGDDVVIVAAPYGRALSVSGGMVSQIDFDKSRNPMMIKTDAAIGYGASGGGMFSVETGKLVGVVEGYRTAKVSIPLAQDTYSFDVPMPGETFAAPAAKIRRFLTSKGLSALLPGSPKAAPAPLASSR